MPAVLSPFNAELTDEAEESDVRTSVNLDDELGSAMLFFEHRKDSTFCPIKTQYVSKPTDDNPFLVHWIPWRSLVAMYQEGYKCHTNAMYSAMKTTKDADYPHKPRDRLRNTRAEVEEKWPGLFLDWKRINMSGYTQPAHGQERRPPFPIFNFSRLLFNLLSHPAGGIRCVPYDNGPQPNMRIENRKFETPALQELELARQRGVALVARQLMRSHQAVRIPPLCSLFLLLITYQVVSAVPIRFNLTGEDVLGPANPDHWHTMQNFAIVMKFNDGFSTILPVSVDIVGGRSVPWQKHGGKTSFPDDNKPSRLLHSTPWSAYETAKPLRNFFNGFPMLQVADAILLQPMPYHYDQGPTGVSNTGENTQHWKDVLSYAVVPRRYASSWYLTHRMSLGQKKRMTPPVYGVHPVNNTRASAAVSFEIEGVGRYTDCRLLVEEIRRLNCRATFKKGRAPAAPFALVYLSDIHVELPSNLPDVPVDAHERVDNRLSCRLSYTCEKKRKAGSPLCERHHERVQDAINSSSWCEDVLVSPRSKTFEFSLPDSPAPLRRVKDLIEAFERAKDEGWAHDAEGIGNTPHPLASIPREYGIVNLSDIAKRHSGDLGYPVHGPGELTDACTRVGFDRGSEFEGRLKTFFTNHFRRNAPTMNVHKTKLENIGFQEAGAVVINWGTTKLDSDTLGRILNDESGLLIGRDSVRLRCEAFDLFHIVLSCLPTGTDGSLRAIWTLVTGGDGSNVNWHTALGDAWALRGIFWVWYHAIKKLLEGE
ncbi:hypothetical protein J4E89_007687 [Alternaria sp. Ai002NY15]|nr:hypothetical protein J4E89_007687 [Alternaria sp. Ai002NY15]